MPVPAAAPRLELSPRGQRQKLILRLLRRPAERPSRRMIARLHPADIAQLFPLLTPDEQSALLDVLFELRLAAKTLRELDVETQRAVLERLADDRLAGTLRRMSANDAVDLLEKLDPERVEPVLALVEPAQASHLRNLMRYGSATAGGLMDPDVPRFLAEETVAETLDRVRQLAEGRRLFYLYVVDERGHLLGIASLWQMVSSPPGRVLREVMSAEVVTVRVDTPEEEVARQFAHYDLLMMPVVDDDGRLAGAITVDDVLDVVEAQATEDLYRLANLDIHEGVATPPLRSVRLRLPWLLVNLATAFLAAFVVSRFQETIAKYVVLAVFMPVVAGMGGNAGTQTLTIMVRGLALGEMDLRRTGAALLRQTAVGAVNGLITGAILAIVALAWERSFLLAATLFVAQTINLSVAGLFGAAVPLALKRAALDPALGSSVFVTTATDVVGFLSFLGTASILLARFAP